MAKTNQTDYTYVASGSLDFLVPFPYLSTSEVEVTVDGASTGVIWTAAQSIQLTPTPAVGALVRVRRNTDARDVRNDFSAGAPFSPRNINENNEQLLYVVQEAVNASQAASAAASGAVATAAGVAATASAADAKAQLALDTVQGSGVNSFKSRTGAVMPEAGDYTAVQITHNASNVGDTLDGLQSAVTLLTDATVAQTSATGAAVIPAGTEAQRPASPVNGQLRYNSETSQFEGYQGGGWKPIGGGDSSPMFSVMWWPQRSAIPAGYVAADGQTLSRATYPDAWAGIQAGNVPTVADATWNSTPTERGKFTAGDGSTTFRLPDYNGKFAGSLGAVFLRGDGALSAAVAGAIQLDEFKAHAHGLPGNTSNGTVDGSVDLNTGGTTASTYSTAGSGGAETRPLNVTGCWVIKLFGAVTEAGSADAAQLASDYANLAGRVTTLEGIGKPFTEGYKSAGQTIVPGGSLTLAHGLGAVPKLSSYQLVCIAADSGYAAGDVVDVGGSSTLGSSTAAQGFQSRLTSTSIIVRCGDIAPFVLHGSTGARAQISPANWRLLVRAWA